MEFLFPSLLNFGAMGCLAAVLLYLHLRSLEEFARERKETLAAFTAEVALERQALAGIMGGLCRLEQTIRDNGRP